MTNREFVSGVLNQLKLLNKDTYIPRRAILSLARSTVTTYVAQRLDSFDITSQFDIITTVDCFEMESVDYVKCGNIELKNCRSIMRSKEKLPETINGRVTSGVLMVTSVDGEYDFKVISFTRFKNKLKNKYVRDKEKYALIQDGYLVLPNSEVETVSLQLLTFESDANEDCGCGNDKKKNGCKKIWDKKFVCPSNILELVRDKVMQGMLVYLQSRKDENPNLDENIKSQVVT